MTVLGQILLAAGSVVALIGVMMVIRHLAKTAGLSSEVQRKLMHVSTGLFALMLPWLFPDRWPVYMLIAATILVMLVLRLPRFSSGLGATLHSVDRTSYGDFLLALSVGLCFLLARDNTLFYIILHTANRRSDTGGRRGCTCRDHVWNQTLRGRRWRQELRRVGGVFCRNAIGCDHLLLILVETPAI